MPDDWRMDQDDPHDAVRGLLLACSVMVLIAALVLVALLWPTPAHGQPLVDMTRYDYTAGPEHIGCYLDDLHYDCTEAGCTAVIECHSDLDGIFRNGFEVTE